MILSKKPLSIVEAREYMGDISDRKELEEYVKKFSKLSKEDAVKLGDEVRALNNPKIKEEQIAKIIDFLPVDSEDLNKIFTDVSLSEEEITSLLSIIKKY